MAGLVKTQQDFFNNSEILNRSMAVFQSSTTWSPANKVLADVYVVGGGGSGGISRVTGTSTNRAVASGGAAGSVGASRLVLEPGTVYTITVGAGGLGSNNNAAGVAGGASEFSGSGITTINAPGGNGGNFDGGSSNILYTAAGATGGGVSTGGNLFNANGSSSGDATADGTGGFDNIAAASGGTAPSIFTGDTSLTSGTAAAESATDSLAASAGSSPTAPSDNVTANAASIGGSAVSGPGGTIALSNDAFTILGQYLVHGSGGGTGVSGGSSQNNVGFNSDPFILASGGQTRINNSSSSTRWGLPGKMGAGGGGFVIVGTTSGTFTHPNGGNGFVAIIPIKLLEEV